MPTWPAHKPIKALQTKVNEFKGRDKKAIQIKVDEIKSTFDQRNEKVKKIKKCLIKEIKKWKDKK